MVERNFKNTEILKKHGILWMKGILKTRKFLKNVEFYNVEFENGRGF